MVARDYDDFIWYTNAFDDNELKQIIEIAKGYQSKDATITGDPEGPRVEEEVRSSNIKWLGFNLETEWIYKRILKYMEDANSQMWEFDWDGRTEAIQYTEYYDVKKGHYDWHMDVCSANPQRKISAVVLLDDDYEGGLLELRSGHGVNHLERKKGNLIVFPSYMLHRVTSVTKGTRRSLVIWSGGSYYR
jgi:PKHD-type hydroxylase